jgi:signal transduction histidine kinase
LINSIRHNGNPNVEICVEVSKIWENNKKLIKFEFKDNGLGISDERKETIFTRRKGFNMKASGMGIGLSLVKKIINSYNGKIWVEDRIKGEFAKGSNFVFLIPEAQ